MNNPTDIERIPTDNEIWGLNEEIAQILWSAEVEMVKEIGQERIRFAKRMNYITIGAVAVLIAGLLVTFLSGRI